MLFEYDVTIQANTTEKTLTEKLLRIERGVIRRISVFYTPQSFHLVKTRILIGDNPIFPKNPSGWSKGSGYADEAEYFIPVLTEPYEVKFQGYNEDEQYDHTVTVRIVVMPVWALYPFSIEMYKIMQQEETGVM